MGYNPLFYSTAEAMQRISGFVDLHLLDRECFLAAIAFLFSSAGRDADEWHGEFAKLTVGNIFI